MSGIKLSKKYGLNPSVLQCPICGKEFALALFGDNYKNKEGKKAEAPHKVAITGNTCEDCTSIINQGGAFFIEVKDEDAKKQVENPYRTGRIIAIKKEAAEELFGQSNPVTYIGETVFEHVFGEALRQEEQPSQQQ